jgi:hypothetical protein
MNFHQSNHIHFNQKCMNFIIQPYVAFQPKVYEFHHPTICSISTKSVWISSSNHMQHLNQKCMNFIIQSYAAFQPKNVGISSSNHIYVFQPKT